ncbi:branched-chain amino acid ABC transporter permease [Paraburkholderia sp.]|uniref:branched-chain amino acid ABC transporter permease n=1 Tax=Paraburkholderia sp. TaxID=1926495 RepID=UPI0039E465A4
MLFIDWNHLLILIAINGVAALGYYVTLSSGQLSIGHGALFALGGYVAALTALHCDAPAVVYLLAGGLGGAVPGYLLSLVTLRLRDIYFAVATFGFGGAVVELIGHLDFFNGQFGLGGVAMYTTLPLALGTLACAVFMVWRWDRSLNYPLAAATRFDPDVALVLGIDVRAIRRATFALGAGTVGVAGALYVGSTTIITPQDGSFEISLALLLMVVIGGTRSWRGPVLGAILWTLLPELLRFASTWRLVLFGAVAIVLMAVRPQGIVGRSRVRGAGREHPATSEALSRH